MGHEFAGDIVKVGKAHQDKFKPGMKFTLQPALNYKGTMWSPGYSYEFFGGDATYCIIPAEVMELGCLLEYKGRAYYEASLAEPMSCSIGAFNAAYHTKMGVYHHDMGIKKGGKLAILAGAGPMGLGALPYFCAYMIAMVIGECINFPIQRNFVFRSKGNLAKQIGWYVLAFCIITCIVNSINCIWVAVAGLLVPDFIYNIGTTVLNGGISMVIFFFVNKIIFPEGEKAAK